MNDRYPTSDRTSTGRVDIEPAIVTAVPDEQPGPVHAVETRPTTSGEPLAAIVLPSAHNSGAVPQEGDRVLVVEVADGVPLVLSALHDEGQPNDAPTLREGERQLGHTASNAHISFTPGGDVTLTADGGATIQLASDGTISINGTSTIQLASDGTIWINGTSTIQAASDGTISINGGSKPVVTDVSLSTTTDNDGHVTDVSLDVTTNSSVLI